MPAWLQAQVSGSQKPWQWHPQSSLHRRSSCSCLFSSRSMCTTPAALNNARLRLEEQGRRDPISFSFALLRSVSSSGTSFTVNLAASDAVRVPLMISYIKKEDTVRRQAIKKSVFEYWKITNSPSVSMPSASPLGVAHVASPFASAAAPPRAPPGWTAGGQRAV